MIIVTADRCNRGKRRELFENARASDVAAVNDHVAPAQERHRFRPQQTMRVRDEAYTWHRYGRIGWWLHGPYDETR
jgi:hypothetical protein